MYLRAQHVTLYYPSHVPAQSRLPGKTPSRLGGTPMLYRGKPVIRALDDVSFSLARGARLGVIGHNGSGKSTLLRVLAGLYLPQQGSVEADGEVSGIFNMSIGFRKEASGYRNIFLKGLMAGKTRREIEAAIPAIAEFTELGPYLDMPLNTYSQGMALRLAFAITTTFSHDILVMDEWIGAGDSQFQEKVVARMNSFLETAHICVIASHSNQLLRRITNQCLWLEDGRARALGETSEILEAYDAETKELRAAAESETMDRRLPIPEGRRVLWSAPAAGRGSMDLHWDVSEFGTTRVTIKVLNPATDKEQIVCSGPAAGQRKLASWVRPGMKFRLLDDLDGLQLATLVVAPETTTSEPESSHHP